MSTEMLSLPGVPKPDGSFVCRKCKERKSSDRRKKDKRYKSGFSSWCKDCHQAAVIRWQKANPERVLAGRRRLVREHPERFKAQRRERYVRDPSIYRWRQIRQHYKLGPTTEAARLRYESMLADQGGGCAICGRRPSDRPLYVDHDHSCCSGPDTCGFCVRGLLCHPCNSAMTAIDQGGSRWAQKAQAYHDEYDPSILRQGVIK